MCDHSAQYLPLSGMLQLCDEEQVSLFVLSSLLAIEQSLSGVFRVVRTLPSVSSLLRLLDTRTTTAWCLLTRWAHLLVLHPQAIFRIELTRLGATHLSSPMEVQRDWFCLYNFWYPVLNWNWNVSLSLIVMASLSYILFWITLMLFCTILSRYVVFKDHVGLFIPGVA